MRTTVVLVIFLLTMGLWSVPALAGDNPGIQQAPAALQPVDDAVLTQMNGKLAARPDLCSVVERFIVSKIPPQAQKQIQTVVAVVRLLGGGGPTKVPVATK